MALLFTPFQLRGLRLKNRIVVSPMCQYQAEDGVANEWHFGHYAALARGGSALVMVEATAVAPEGRITRGCTGLWTDAQAEALGRVARAIKAGGAVPGLQLGHAGRKASLMRPWESDGDTQLRDGWQTIAPSALAAGGKMPRPPREMTLAEIAATQADFVMAAKRALEAGFEWLELHFAHGFLAQSFFAASANRRTDLYGGSPDRRARFLTETLAAVRQVWPERLPLAVKFGCVEFDGHDDARRPEVLALLQRFKALGADLLDASVGFTETGADIPWAPGMLVPVAAQMRQATGLAVGVSWGLEDPQLAEAVIAGGQADLVMIAKAMLANPHHPYAMALALKEPAPAAVLPIAYGHWLNRYGAA